MRNRSRSALQGKERGKSIDEESRMGEEPPRMEGADVDGGERDRGGSPGTERRRGEEAQPAVGTTRTAAGRSSFLAGGGI